MLNVATSLGAQHDAKRVDHSNAVRGRTTTGGEVVENRPPVSAEAVRDHLRFTRAEVPVLNCWNYRYVREAV